jgi:diaminopimelate decarboxylase
MFLPEGCAVNPQGHLTIGGCDALDLAREYGTPVYVLNETVIQNACRAYLQSFETYYHGKGMPVYASKALNCLEICRLMHREGLGLDVVSGGELFTALKAGFPAEKIHFHGNNKSEEELKMALRAGVGVIVLDHFQEIGHLEQLAEQAARTVNVSMRIKPGIDAHTHSFIRTGQIDSKFGFALETGEALKAVKQVLQCGHLRLTELHCHIGSQIFDIAPFVHAAEVMMDLRKEIFDTCGYTVGALNLGGGFGIRYTEEDSPKPYANYMEQVSQKIFAKADESGMPVPYIYLEPGRSIVGEAGITLYRVGVVKQIPDVRTYVSVDGGMADNPRYSLYHASYSAAIADRAGQTPQNKVTIAGRCCETDLLQENILLHEPRPGDVLAMFGTGAYNYSMASNYNRLPRPPVVMVKDGCSRLIVRRETYEDLLRNDV